LSYSELIVESGLFLLAPHASGSPVGLTSSKFRQGFASKN